MKYQEIIEKLIAENLIFQVKWISSFCTLHNQEVTTK